MSKAYNSISWEAMKLALERINIPQPIILLLGHLHSNRYDQIITSQGLTELYYIEDRIDQGETHSPLLWCIFYNPILTYIDKIHQTRAYPIGKENTDTVERISHLAFVDDTA